MLTLLLIRPVNFDLRQASSRIATAAKSATAHKIIINAEGQKLSDSGGWQS